MDYETCKYSVFKSVILGNEEDYCKKIGVEPWVYTGAVSYEELKADFVDYADFSPDLVFDGVQLELSCEGFC